MLTIQQINQERETLEKRLQELSDAINSAKEGTLAEIERLINENFIRYEEIDHICRKLNLKKYEQPKRYWDPLTQRGWTGYGDVPKWITSNPIILTKILKEGSKHSPLAISLLQGGGAEAVVEKVDLTHLAEIADQINKLFRNNLKRALKQKYETLNSQDQEHIKDLLQPDVVEFLLTEGY